MNNRLFKNTIAVIVTVIMVFSFSVLSFAKEKVDLTKYFTPQKLEELEKVYTVEELEKMLEVELENDKKIHENAKSRILIHLENIDSKTLKSNDELKKYLSQNNPDLLGYIKDIEIFSTDPEDGDSVPEVYKEAFIGIRLNEEGQKKIDDVVEKLREVKGVVMADMSPIKILDLTLVKAKLAETYRIHTVSHGESLWTIAQKYLGKGNRYTEIVKLNKLKSNAIYSGMKLKIPK